MNKIATYRFVAMVLVVIFGLFNIGLPIVIYACPMMNKAPNASTCCARGTNEPGAHFQASVDRSCCKTIYAAERNATEFVQSNNHFTVFQYSTAPILQHAMASSPQIALFSINLCSSSPPLHTDDIPILTSSLLI